tara:strand:+ start:336 stop:554 length:219 start_codon:yes stop_codon:yes gene_type:complete
MKSGLDVLIFCTVSPIYQFARVNALPTTASQNISAWFAELREFYAQRTTVLSQISAAKFPDDEERPGKIPDA